MIWIGYLIDSDLQDLEPSLSSLANHVNGITIGIRNELYSRDYVELINLFAAKYRIRHYNIVKLSTSFSFLDSWKEIFSFVKLLCDSSHTCTTFCQCVFIPLTCYHQLNITTNVNHYQSYTDHSLSPYLPSLKEIYGTAYTHNLFIIPLRYNWILECPYEIFSSLTFRFQPQSKTTKSLRLEKNEIRIMESIFPSWTFILSFNILQCTHEARIILSRRSLYEHDSNFWLHLAIKYFRLARFRDVIFALEYAIKKNTFSPPKSKYWYSLYLLSRSYLHLVDFPHAANYALQAFERNKNRLEPLYYLAHFARIHNLSPGTFQKISSMVIQDCIPKKTEKYDPTKQDMDIDMDIDVEISEWKWLTELAYHLNTQVAMDSLEKLRFHNFPIPSELRLTLLWHQRSYCIRPLRIIDTVILDHFFLNQRTQEHEIAVWNYLNPSIISLSISDLKTINIPQFIDGPWTTNINKREFFLVAVRAVNYKLSKDTESYLVCHENTEKKIRSRNFIVLLDTDYKFQQKWELYDLRNKVAVEAPSYGPEDGKVFIYQNSLYYSFNAVDAILRNGIPCIGLSKIHSATQLVKLGNKIIKSDTILCVHDEIYLDAPSIHPLKPEKNWLPLIKDNKLYFNYWPCPISLFEINLTDGTITNKIKIPNILNYTDFRNSAGPILFQNGWLLVAHELNEKKKEGKERSKYYLHRFLWYTNDFQLQKMSYPFTFWNVLVEYCNGIAWRILNKRLVLSVGYFDQQAFLLEVDAMDIDKMLKPFDVSNLGSQIYPFFSRSID